MASFGWDSLKSEASKRSSQTSDCCVVQILYVWSALRSYPTTFLDHPVYNNFTLIRLHNNNWLCFCCTLFAAPRLLQKWKTEYERRYNALIVMAMDFIQTACRSPSSKTWKTTATQQTWFSVVIVAENTNSVACLTWFEWYDIIHYSHRVHTIKRSQASVWWVQLWQVKTLWGGNSDELTMGGCFCAQVSWVT